MAETKESVHGQWSGRWGYVLAATGSAVGLGNIWKFPYITGENGGGAFVLVYLGCVLLIGIPVMMGEVLMGRRGRQSPIHTLRALAQEAGASPLWQGVGWMGVLAGFLILAFYAVIAGWALAYVFVSGSGTFSGASAEEVAATFTNLTDSPVRLIVWTTLVLGFTFVVVGRGVEKGLERAVRYMMPGMLILLFVLVGYAMNSGHFMEGVTFLFKPDFGKITAGGVLVALGHAFFTLSLASGVMMAYGSYLPKNTSIAGTTIIVAFADTAIALLAGLAIFPVVFANGLEPGSGPGLIFVTLPIAFGQMPFGTLFGTLFFVMLVLAALTSAISLLEPAVAWMVERFRISRVAASAIGTAGLWILGLGTVFSFNIGADIKIFGKNFFEAQDYLTANIMLPLGGLFVAVFTAWIMSPRSTRDELSIEGWQYTAWSVTMRYIAPLSIVIVFLHAVGLLQKLIDI